MARTRFALALVLASFAAVVFATTALADPPLAASDTYSVTGSSLTVAAPGVLANDTYTAPATVAPSGPGPLHGSLTLNADGSFEYTPEIGFTGVDTFDYGLADSIGIAPPVTVTLIVDPAVAPLLTAADSYDAFEGTTFTAPTFEGVLANDSGNGALSAAVVANPANGSLNFNPDGSFSYEPTAGFVGDDSFTYTATDATPATSGPTTVTIHVHGPPTAAADNYSVGANSTLHVAAGGLLANDTAFAPTVQVPGPSASNGTLTVNADGSFDYTPNADFAGTDSFTYVVLDGPYASTPATVTITVNPTPPANDTKAGAHDLGADSGAYSGSSVFATTDSDDPYTGYGLYPSVWFTYAPTQSGQLTVDTCGTNYDHYLIVYDSAGNFLAGNEWACAWGKPQLHVDAGSTYYVELNGMWGVTGPYTLNWLLQGPPANDGAANAEALQGDSGSVTGTTDLATSQPSDPGYGYASPSVWYAYTPSQSGVLAIDDCGPFAGSHGEYIAVTDLSGSTLSGPSYLPCYYGKLQLNVQAGTTYLIDVTGYYGNTGAFTLNWTLHPPPANDDWENAQVLAPPSGSVAGTTTGASAETGDLDSRANVWYAYTAPGDGVLKLDTCGANDTTIIAVYSADHSTNLATQYGGCSPLNQPVSAATTYLIMVSTYYGDGVDFPLHYSFLGQPGNDGIDGAQALTGDTGSVTGDSTAASDSGLNYTFGGHDVFFTYTPSADGTAIFSSRSSSFQSAMNVLADNGSGGWTSLATGNRVVTSVNGGSTYLVVLDGCCPSAYGPYQLDYDFGPPAANDTFANRELVSFGGDGSISGNNDYSTAEPLDITNGGQSNWYEYTPDHAGSLLLQANGVGFTPQIAVGSPDGGGGVLSDGFSGNGRLVVPVVSGKTYYIAVDANSSGGQCGECATATLASAGTSDGITGDYSVDLSLNGPPANDLSANAIMLSGDNGSTNGTTLGATGDGDAFSGNGSGVWYLINPGRYGRLSISASGDRFYPQISAGTTLSGPSGSSFGSLQTLVQGDSPIYIEIDGDPNQQSNFTLSWSFQQLTPPSGAVRNLAFCSTNTFFRNDDGSTGPVNLGFGLNFFGNTFSSLYVNNNGNVTFTRPLGTYTPFNVTSQTGLPIIAPYFADVDTRNAASGQVHYGAGEIDGRPAFCVNWLDAGFGGNKGVGYYGSHADKLNTFQLLLISRDDRGAGDFDIEMNYDNMQWETGDASGGSGGFGGTPAEVAYTNGSGRSFLLPGSFSSGHLTDGGPDALVSHSLNSPDQLGRYLFQVANGEAPIGQNISGHVFFNDTTHPLHNALVQVCSASGFCSLGNTGTDGSYSFSGVPDGNQRISAFPPAGIDAPSQHLDVVMAGSPFSNEDMILHGPVPPPPGEGLTPNRSNGEVVYWNDPLTLGARGCTGGTATYLIDFSQSETGGPNLTGDMTESVDEPGFYTAPIGTFYPRHGHIHITTTITCPGGAVDTEDFDVYIDPSGTVVDQAGHAIANATVTLERATSSSGPWSVVPNGSAIMASDNRNNPDHTDTAGHFGWNVVTGWYRVTATSPGCTSATTDPVQIPPAVLDLVLTLTCPQATTTSLTSAPSSVLVTQMVGYEAHVSGPAGGPTATGTVHFIQDGVEIGASALDAHGIATLPWAYSAPGDKHVLAHYDGDAANLASDSNGVTTAVGLDTPAVSVSSDVDPSVFGQSVTFTAQIAANTTLANPTGTVSFQVDGTAPVDVATVTDGTPGTARAQFTISSLAAGSHAINVQYNGDGAHTTATDSMTQTVARDATTTAVTSSLDPSVFGDSVAFTAHVTSTQGTTPVGAVVFTVDGSPIGTGSSPVDGHGEASFSTSTLSVGDHTVAAFFDSLDGYIASTGSVTQTVTRHASSTAVSSSHNPSSYGDTVTFDVDVSGPSSGTVSLTVDGTAHTLALAAGHAQYTTSSLVAGDHAVQASYVGDTTYAPSDATPLTQTVDRADTALALSSSTNPSLVGQLVGFTAHVTSGGAPVSEGSVVFTDGVSPLATVPLDAAGNAVASVTFGTTGPHAIHAAFAESADYNGSSGSLDQAVAKAISSTVATAAPGSTTFGNLVTLSAAVTGVLPTGSVTFTDGTAVLGTVPLAGGVATFHTTILRTGDHPITAAYSGDGANEASSGTTSVHIDKASSAVHVFSGHNPSALGELVGFTIAVSYAGPDPAGTVQVLVDGAAVATLPVDAAGTALYSTAFTTAGTHTVAAQYEGNALNLGSTSSTFTQSVSKATPTTTLGAGPDPTPFGTAVPLTATVAGGYFPTGSVTFKEGATTIATVPLGTGGTASASATGLAAGSHTFTATYSGDGNNNAGADGTVSHVVSPAATATAVTSSTSPSVFGGGVTFTVTVSSPAGTPGGSVTLADGATPLATLTLAGGTASYSTSTLAVGTHAITASYGGAANYAPSSGSLSQVVNKAASASTVASALNPAVAGQSVTFNVNVSGPSGIPSGTVTLLDGTTTLATLTLSTAGQASYATSTLAAGSHSISAHYNGDATYLASTSAVLTQVITAGTTLKASKLMYLGPILTGDRTPTMLARLSDAGNLLISLTGRPITFSIDGGAPQSTTTTILGLAAITVNHTLSYGTHTVVIRFAGDSAYAATSTTASFLVSRENHGDRD